MLKVHGMGKHNQIQCFSYTFLLREYEYKSIESHVSVELTLISDLAAATDWHIAILASTDNVSTRDARRSGVQGDSGLVDGLVMRDMAGDCSLDRICLRSAIPSRIVLER